MKIKTLLIVLLAVFFLLPSCKNKKRRAPRNDKMAISMSQNAKGDSAIYGLACEGTNDSAVVLLPNQGGDPIKYRIVWAMNNHQVFGTPSIGDWICVIPQADSKNSARMVIDLDQIKGTWTHAVKPVFKDISGISRKQIREMFENMPDSIKETYLVPREYGFTLSRQSKAQAIGRIYGSNDEESPVKYPEVPHYTEWHAYNGKLILVQGRVEYNNIVYNEKEKRDTFEFVYLHDDSLAIRSTKNKEIFSYHRKDAKTVNEKAKAAVNKQAERQKQELQ